MKKKLFTLFALPFMLAGCANHQGIKTSEALAHIKNFETPEATYYSASCEYYFNTKHQKVEDEGDLVYKPVKDIELDYQDGEDVTKSYFLDIPLTLNASNFYVMRDGELDINDSMYGIIKTRLIYPAGTINEVYINKTSDGGIKFESFNSFVDIYSLNLEIDTARARINGYFEFDNSGLLVKEHIETVGFSAKKAAKDSSMFLFDAQYTYSD